MSRLISLVLLLQSGGTMTAGELAEQLEVSERTIYRDILALSAAGVPVYAEQGRAGGYRLLDGYRTRLTGLSRAEAEALFLSGLPGPVRDMGLGESLAAAQLKVVAALPATLRDASSRARQRFHLDVPGWFRDADPPPLLAELARAVWEDRVVVLTYRRREEVVRTVEPLGLVLKTGSWYLVGRVGGSVRTYRVDRATAVTVTDTVFERDGSFDLAAFWGGQALEFERGVLREQARIRLSPTGARLLRHTVEALAARAVDEQAATPGADGWVVVTLPVESVAVARTQLLGLGPEVEVLDPPELRDLMRAAAVRMTELYR
ncbi:YafY family transcriptional regulator [Dactylosporangium roseum]|uniref:YafY family transcriptional regulator n=1 Tax=Dactylosporangium roseum TaxID=47989 RepID=A0ABY5ZEG3_9ACTN|nr:YafY family protein [Dactylosporangium roseum]UWZ40505.1 YafY family transcriptional regulator [Dactylosporangium roseum]